jgi:hypothetical protein
MLVNKNLKLWKWMGFANVFIGCSWFDMYVKGGNKKIWHEMILFFSKYVRMNKYNIISICFRSDFGHVSIVMWFSGMIFHKTQIYATHIVVVMEVGVEFQVIWFMYMQNVVIMICDRMNMFSQSPNWNPS